MASDQDVGLPPPDEIYQHDGAGWRCYYKPDRKERRPYSPRDLARIYGYVVRDYGLEQATCAVLCKSGLATQAQEIRNLMAFLPTCRDLFPLPVTDLDVPEPDPCEEEEGSWGIAASMKGVLALLIIIWGYWRRAKATRVWRFVLRRFIVFALLAQVLDLIGAAMEFMLASLPVIERMQELTDRMTCDGYKNCSTAAAGASQGETAPPEPERRDRDQDRSASGSAV